MRKILIGLLIFYVSINAHSQNLPNDLGKANLFFLNNKSFSLVFKYSFYTSSVKEKPVFTKTNNAYRYLDRFYLWTEEREFIYKNKLSLTVDFNNGVIAIQDAVNPINEILSSGKLSIAIKDFKYTLNVEGNSKVYNVNYPENNQENIKKLRIYLRKSDNFFQKMVVYYLSDNGSYKNSKAQPKYYRIMEVAYENFILNPKEASEKTDFDKYVTINGGKAILRAPFSKYILSDLRAKKNKK